MRFVSGFNFLTQERKKKEKKNLLEIRQAGLN